MAAEYNWKNCGTYKYVLVLKPYELSIRNPPSHGKQNISICTPPDRFFVCSFYSIITVIIIIVIVVAIVFVFVIALVLVIVIVLNIVFVFFLIHLMSIVFTTSLVLIFVIPVLVLVLVINKTETSLPYLVLVVRN